MEWQNVVMYFVGIAFTMRGQDFVQPKTLLILGIGLAGISTFPIASHVAQKLATEEDSSNIILMQVAAANVAGQICSAIIGGVFISIG